MRTICPLAAALVLSGCTAQSSYSEFIAKSHSDYERAVLSGEAQQPDEATTTGGGFLQTAKRVPAFHPGRRPRETAQLSSPSSSAGTGEVQAGSPAWEKEADARLEELRKDFERKLPDICTGC
jgi:hypothetical protein